MANTGVDTEVQYMAGMHYVTAQWTPGALAGRAWPPPIRQALPMR